MKSFVSKLRALIIGKSKTSLKEDTKVNTFELGVVTFRTLKPEEDHPFEQQEVQVIASPGAPLSELRQSLKSGALEGGESTPHSPKDILVETSPISSRRAVKRRRCSRISA